MWRRPPNVPRQHQCEQHLVVRIIGARWVRATGQPKPGLCWHPVERIA